MGSPKAAIGAVARETLAKLNILPPERNGEEDPGRRYRPRNPRKSRFRQIIEREFDRVKEMWDRFESRLGPWLYRYGETAEKFLACGLPERGYSKFQCQTCGEILKVAFSCKTRLCPSCAR